MSPFANHKPLRVKYLPELLLNSGVVRGRTIPFSKTSSLAGILSKTLDSKEVAVKGG
jgi:hypothetical protein